MPYCLTLALAAIVAVTSLGGIPADDLVGTWQGTVTVDGTELASHSALQGATELQTRGVAMVFRALAAPKRMTLEFRGDGTATNRLTSFGQTREKSGSWKVVSRSDDRVVVEFAVEGQRDTTQFAFRPLGPDEMELIIEPPGDLARGFRHRFRRQAAE